MEVILMKLQYEILNTPFSQLAVMSGISEDMIKDEATKAGWKQHWPDEPAAIIPAAINNVDDPDQPVDDYFMSSTADCIDKCRRRLQIYTLAKDSLLAMKYLELEFDIVSKASELITEVHDNKKLTASDLKCLSSLYKDMSSNTNLTSSSVSLGIDDSGLPTLVFKDLSGKK